jgi:hypothetical protein
MIDQAIGQAVVKIRPSPLMLIPPFALVGLILTTQHSAAAGDSMGHAMDLILYWLFGLLVVTSPWTLTLGVDLKPEAAILRGFRRRTIAWQEVQAVLRFEQLGSSRVRLILENGKPVMLRAPRREWGLGGAAFDRDFHRIGQWWLAHRGESWRPVSPEAPRPHGGLPDPR